MVTTHPMATVAMLVIHQMFWREFEAIADLA